MSIFIDLLEPTVNPQIPGGPRVRTIIILKKLNVIPQITTQRTYMSGFLLFIGTGTVYSVAVFEKSWDVDYRVARGVQPRAHG